MAALTGGGVRAKPGEVSLAHNGVLFLDELPEFSAQALDSLRQPLETGEVMVARANHHVRYPGPGAAGGGDEPLPLRPSAAPARGHCGKAPRCQLAYQGRVSGPLLDRIDLQVEVPPVTAADLALPPPAEGTAEVAARVPQAREVARRARRRARPRRRAPASTPAPRARWLETIAALDAPGQALLAQAAEAGGLTARGWTRTLRLARTIADLEGATGVRAPRPHRRGADLPAREPGAGGGAGQRRAGARGVSQV